MHLLRTAPTEARPLSPALREELGLGTRARKPYRWTFAFIVVGTACAPLVLAKLWAATIVAVFLGLVVLPAMRWFESRDAASRADIYRFGIETTGRVLEVEPAGPGATDHVVRLTFLANGTPVRASVVGCPLARRGLEPDHEVEVFYLENRPARCVVGRRIGAPLANKPHA